VEGIFTRDDRFVFRGWYEDMAFTADVKCDELAELTEYAKTGLQEGKGNRRGKVETLVGLGPLLTARIVYENLVETYIEIGGFYMTGSFTMRLPLDMCDQLVEISRLERQELEHSEMKSREDLPY